MKIAICASMVFSEEMLRIKRELESLGHEAVVSDFLSDCLGKTEREKEEITIFHKNESGAIREFWDKIKESDAVLIVNLDRRGIKNYIGGNTLMEIGFAHVLNKKIFLMNPIPEIPFYQSEIEAAKPIILHGDLSRIK